MTKDDLCVVCQERPAAQGSDVCTDGFCRAVDRGEPICGAAGQGCRRHGFDQVQTRFSLGIYAGRWCDEHWATSGYRTEGPEGFDELDAGESYEPEPGVLGEEWW